MIKIVRKSLHFVYSATCDHKFSSVKVLNRCGKFWAVEVASNPMNTLQRNQEWWWGSGPVGCQIFSGHEKYRESTVINSLQQSRNKKYHDDR